MKRLSGTDALFLSTEMPVWHQHVGGLTIVDPSESDRFSFEEMRRTILERLEQVPKFRWKLKEVPLRLDRAVWSRTRTSTSTGTCAGSRSLLRVVVESSVTSWGW